MPDMFPLPADGRRAIGHARRIQARGRGLLLSAIPLRALQAVAKTRPNAENEDGFSCTPQAAGAGWGPGIVSSLRFLRIPSRLGVRFNIGKAHAPQTLRQIRTSWLCAMCPARPCEPARAHFTERLSTATGRALSEHSFGKYS